METCSVSKSYPFAKAPKELLREVWENAKPITGFDPTQWRQDMRGAFMCYDEHDNQESRFGWEIGRILSTDLGGTNDPKNLQPLNWFSNRKGQSNLIN